MHGISLNFISAYHPQSDGQTKIVNKCVQQYLRCFVNQRPKEWVKWLPWAEWWYNTSVHSSTKMTPFEALYGVPPPTLLQYVTGTIQNAELDFQLRSREEIINLLRKNLLAAQGVMKQQYDKNHTPREFQVGDMVYLRLQKYKQHSVAHPVNYKLAPNFFGPFKVLQRIGDVAYKLELPSSDSVHPIFHVSSLKKHVGSTAVVSSALPMLDSHGGFRIEPELIL